MIFVRNFSQWAEKSYAKPEGKGHICSVRLVMVIKPIVGVYITMIRIFYWRWDDYPQYKESWSTLAHIVFWANILCIGCIAEPKRSSLSLLFFLGHLVQKCGRLETSLKPFMCNLLLQLMDIQITSLRQLKYVNILSRYIPPKCNPPGT